MGGRGGQGKGEGYDGGERNDGGREGGMRRGEKRREGGMGCIETVYEGL